MHDIHVPTDPASAAARRGTTPSRSARAAAHRGSARRAGPGRIIARLTPRDRWLIRMLHEHGHLTTPQLVALGFASLRMTQARLRTLHALEVTDRFRPFTTHGSHPLHHILGPVGARVLAAEEGLDPRQLGWRHDRALAAAHRHTLTHDTATTDLICRLATTPDITLTRWWSPTRCTRYFGHHTRPDTYLALTLAHWPAHNPGGRHPLRRHNLAEPAPDRPELAPERPGLWWEAFVEYDTGTEALAVLAAKLHGYHNLATTTGITTPLLIWTARPGREPGARAALTHTLHTLPHPHLLPIATATATATTTTTAATGASPMTVPPAPGELGRVWLPLTADTPPDASGRRLTLTELATTLRPSPPHRANRTPHRDLLDPRRRPTGHTVPIHELDRPDTGLDLPAPPPHPPRHNPNRDRSTTGHARRW